MPAVLVRNSHAGPQGGVLHSNTVGWVLYGVLWVLWVLWGGGKGYPSVTPNIPPENTPKQSGVPPSCTPRGGTLGTHVLLPRGSPGTQFAGTLSTHTVLWYTENAKASCDANELQGSDISLALPTGCVARREMGGRRNAVRRRNFDSPVFRKAALGHGVTACLCRSDPFKEHPVFRGLRQERPRSTGHIGTTVWHRPISGRGDGTTFPKEAGWMGGGTAEVARRTTIL